MNTSALNLQKPVIKKSAVQRRYDLDWLRVIAILILLYYHVGMIYVSWGWHIKHEQSSRLLEIVMVFLHQWRMPLLFTISGIGTYFALGFRSARQYSWERTKRLFFPVLFGMLVIVPPQIYLERLFRGENVGSYLHYYPRVYQFIPYPAGDFSWHHLWFVVYLFFYSLLFLPIFLYFRQSFGQKLIDRFAAFAAKPGGILYLLIPLLLVQWVLRPIFPQETHALTDDWANFAFNAFFFVFGYFLGDQPQIWESLLRQRRIYLSATLLAMLAMYVVYFTPAEKWMLPNLPLGFRYWWLVTMTLAWFSVVTSLAYGYKYLNRSHPWLKVLNEGIYPFYILHQTVIIIIGYQVLQWHWGIWLGFFFVSTASMLTCVGIYGLVIRPFDGMRFLFGMKGK